MNGVLSFVFFLIGDVNFFILFFIFDILFEIVIEGLFVLLVIDVFFILG